MQDQKQTKRKIVIPGEIRGYLEDVLYRAGIVDIDNVVKEAIMEELFVRLDQFLSTKIIEYLPVEKLDEFTGLIEEQPAPEKVQTYLQENLPNAQDVFMVAFGEFRDMYIQNVNKAQNKSV